jgi:hypothetical protein
VFILLPFLDEDSLNELSEHYGNPLRQLYGILRRSPEAFERFVHLLSHPLWFEVLDEFAAANETAKSRSRLRLLVDDTKAEKFGHCMEFLHKLFDHCHQEYILGYNSVLVLVVSGSFGFPLSFILWLPKEHPKYRSKNDIVRDEVLALQTTCEAQGYDLSEVEFLGDSAYCVQKVFSVADGAGCRVIPKPGNTHKFQGEGAHLSPKEVIEKVKGRTWKSLDAKTGTTGCRLSTMCMETWCWWFDGVS